MKTFAIVALFLCALEIDFALTKLECRVDGGTYVLGKGCMK